jgi:hypothetical protein
MAAFSKRVHLPTRTDKQVQGKLPSTGRRREQPPLSFLRLVLQSRVFRKSHIGGRNTFTTRSVSSARETVAQAANAKKL